MRDGATVKLGTRKSRSIVGRWKACFEHDRAVIAIFMASNIRHPAHVRMLVLQTGSAAHTKVSLLITSTPSRGNRSSASCALTRSTAAEGLAETSKEVHYFTVHEHGSESLTLSFTFPLEKYQPPPFFKFPPTAKISTHTHFSDSANLLLLQLHTHLRNHLRHIRLERRCNA